MDKTKYLITTLLCALSYLCHGQTDSTFFKGTFYNEEYQVYLTISFHDQDVAIPGQEIFGNIPGFFGDSKDSRKWLITSATVKGNTAYMEIINDYGSEDLEAELTHEADGNYTLRQKKGSTIKIARNREWVKIPKILTFTPKR